RSGPDNECKCGACRRSIRQRHAIKTFFLGVFLRSLQRDQVFVLESSSFGGGGSYTISFALLRLACSARRRNAQPKFSSSVRFSGSLSHSALASNSAARNRDICGPLCLFTHDTKLQCNISRIVPEMLKRFATHSSQFPNGRVVGRC